MTEPVQEDATFERRRAALQAAREASEALAAADTIREEIGRHLHDHVQALGVAARQQLALGRVEQAIELVDELNDELRAFARGLHPAGLERGLGDALRRLAAAAGLDLEVVHLPAHPLGGAVETTIHALVAEAVTNAAKHADATTVVVDVRVGAATVTAEVRDDGSGADIPVRGTGLLGVEDRLRRLEGTLEITSVPGRGTTLRAEIPVALVRANHKPYLALGDAPDGADRLEETIALWRSGRKSASISLAREWATEGGPPRLSQRLPVIDARGRSWLTVEITALVATTFGALDPETYRACAIPGDALPAWRARVRAFYDAHRPALVVLFGEPDWRLTEDEPMVVLRHRVVDDEAQPAPI